MSERASTKGLIFDSFAGGGGASLGIEWALGRGPDFAVNHDADALLMHARNHPQTIHLQENIWKVDPHAVSKGKPVFLLWASPDCRHHSKAKGGKPVSRSVRGLADVILLWAQEVKPQIILLENVEEFRDWGPLGEDGMPIKAKKGMEFARWVRGLEARGYMVEFKELRACDYGTPTIRKRLFVVARRDMKPIIFPKPTHGAGLKPYRTAAEIIDWSIRAPSIFMTKVDARAEGLNIIRPLADKSMARIAKGFDRHVLKRAKSQKGAFVVGMTTGASAPFVGVNRFESDGQPIDVSMPTVTANSFLKRPGAGGPLSVIAPMLSYAQQGGGSRPADEPHHTVCANAKDQNQVIMGYLVSRYGERPGQEPRSRSLEEPAPTIVPTGNGGELAAIYLAQHNLNAIGRPADEPTATLATAGAQVQPVMGFIASMQNNTARGAVDEPVGAVLAGGNHHAVVTPYVSEMRGRSEARGADDALSTATGQATHGLMAPFIGSYYSEGSTDAAADAPMPTVPTKARFSPVHCHIAVPPMTPAMLERAKMVARFLHAHGVWHDPDVLVEIAPGLIVWDIGMRMLTPRELARAQGFPDSYDITAGGQLTETAQRHKIGNSVCPQVAAAIVRANCIEALTRPDLKRRKRCVLPRFDDIRPDNDPTHDLFGRASR
ncbi:DNA (cytosine-5)-methyltransferase 1 [Bosea sp. AK1]|uniref:DNA cytosine methyltransferase n=1 Tax=Bosea sp. AK1 TaxID=2587160 RepID=UPI00114D96E1|nr:DNA cytosine methyltransferase [Bosea sp. AK1]TQI72858.1 DNA (cytosine-5)-methyltransferase 1 [Bosea sp. AK1]